MKIKTINLKIEEFDKYLQKIYICEKHSSPFFYF